VRLIISDTGPINYLVLIGHIDILPAFSQKIIMPLTVQEELGHLRTPLPVRKWIAHPPTWLEVREPPAHSFDDASLAGLGEGERDASKLAAALDAKTLLLMDDRTGVRAARRKGLAVTGTIGILEEAALEGLLNLADAFARLQRTTFRFPEDLAKQLLDKQEDKTQSMKLSPAQQKDL
jgi:predicted nucleic acid-binding protein